jgi:hypothetical protein
MSSLGCVMSLKKMRIKLSKKVVRDLKEVSRLSSVKKWEYAGNVKYKKYDFEDLEYVTSRRINRVLSKEIKKVWNEPITFHTHPGITEPGESIDDDMEIFTTLPSNADFYAYIRGSPLMQVNIICDSHGYYVIDIHESVYKFKLPLPEAVYTEMSNLRKTPGLKSKVFNEDGVEYFCTSLKNWKRLINGEVNPYMSYLFGINIRYYTYNDEPPIVTVFQED